VNEAERKNLAPPSTFLPTFMHTTYKADPVSDLSSAVAEMGARMAENVSGSAINLKINILSAS